ncbi:terminase small subunit [Lactobacillus sp. PFC-70]|uniref:P27 family phage terminase small subunit n=1 Tax=Levilactobacillus namurensis TaxID=380393 RepID=UPI000466C492|nr:P27 family phage terminase small subunit [Levilactobacillus namurensis]MCW3778503.1 P27 family phage terminase small subunit [Levilactobacillus namurensis]MDT7019576.1 terminase small subunit [Levilactobacillus namurensis]PTM21533.1 terminase small subunit [Lactobacillus sp. PFC-70]WNN65836.1 terminase small subunit [Levilactobacillus namurensis]
MGRKTKRQVETEQLAEKVEAERKRLLFLLRDADVYSQILDPLIDSYLDTFEVYEIMYKRWKDKGFPETQVYENKNGAKNAVKHPLSVQVDIWSEKKLRALDKLGMTNKALMQRVVTGGSTIDTNTGNAESSASKPIDELQKRRERWRKKA